MDYGDAQTYGRLGPLDAARWRAKPGRETDLAALRQRVNLLSGPAAAAVGAKGLSVAPPAAIGGPIISVNPIAAWAQPFSAPTPYSLTLQEVTDFVDSAIGELEALVARHRQRERSIAGLVARFFAFPSAVREAAGVEPHTRPAAAATGLAVFFQITVATAIGTVLAAGVIAVIRSSAR